MSILAEVQDSVKAAMKAGDKQKVAALRMVVCELQNEAKRTRTDLDEGAELAVLRRELKKRQESMEAFRAGGREDLAVFEEYAAGLIEGLLPKQMNESELPPLSIASSPRPVLLPRATWAKSCLPSWPKGGRGWTARWLPGWSRSVYPREGRARPNYGGVAEGQRGEAA